MPAVTVVNSAYQTLASARPQVLSNNWIIVATYESATTKIHFHADKRDGSGFVYLGFRNVAAGAGFSTTSKGTTIYVMAALGTNSTNVVFKFDVTQATGGDVSLLSSYQNLGVDSGQSALGAVSLTYNPVNDCLEAAWSSKNTTYPGSFNIRYAKGTIDGNGNVSWGSGVQITTHNASNANHVNPCIVVLPNGRPVIIHEYQNSADNRILVSRWNGSAWEGAVGTTTSVAGTTVYFGGSYAQANPCAVVDGNGVIHVVWIGTDSGDMTYSDIRYSKSTDGGATWSAMVNITNSNTISYNSPTLAVDLKNKLHLIYYQASNGYLEYRSMPNGAAWSGASQLTTGNNSGSAPSVMEKEKNSMIGWIYKDTTAASVKFDSIAFNQPPTLTLTSPSDNQTLAEGNQLPLEGTAVEADAGNVVTVKYKINNGSARALQSGVSNGSTPISFAKTLTYSNKRIWDGTTDVVGVDLAENTDHTLTVWAEDDQGGKSAEITRKFRVVWNRPPTISGENGDLGIMEEPPSVEYSITEPETNPFTVTEKINGQIIRTFAGVAGRQETITIPHDMWLRLEPGVPHSLTIEASDDQGMTSTRTYTLTRFVDKIVFSLDFATMQQETKDFFTTDVAAKRLLLTPIWDMPPGAILLVEVCNNAYDEEPSWEDATIVVKLNRAHLFANETKTAAEWGINFRVRIEKGTATQPIYVKGVGGAFD
ncbi:sialidase family protein [Brevibacillus agri]|uniref:sialidase family protein n=1 Tax=Brevibacillus agri TaxID=51101 RepID=UPI003D232730